MKKTLLLMSLLMISASSSLCFAQTAVQLKSQQALSTSLKNKHFVADLKQGFHFNDKAPNAILTDGQEILPVIFKAKHLEFTLPENYKQAEAALYVCDDAITFCETHHLPLKGEKSGPIIKSKAQKSRLTAEGFIQDDLQKALQQAGKKKQLVLVDFSARWCPGCVRYEKEIFGTAEFKKLTKNFIKLKIDVDQFENFPLAEKYKILGIPTFVILDDHQLEIDRLLDFQPLGQLKPFFKALEAKSSLQDLIVQNSTAPTTDPKIRQDIGLRLYNGGRYEESIPYLQGLTPAPPELINAQIMSLDEKQSKDPTKKAAFVEILRQSLKTENKSSRSLAWRSQLLRNIDKKSAEAQSLLASGLALADELLKNPKALMAAVQTDQIGDFLDFEKLAVAQTKADLVEASEASPEVIRKAWKQAAQIGAELKIPPSRTGPALRYLGILSQAQMWPEAEALSNEILKNDPTNTDIQRRQIKILMEQKKYAQAEALGENLIKTAEGRVQFWIAESLAKAYIAGAATNPTKKASAKSLLTAYLARPEIQDEKMAGSKKKMEDLLKSIE